MGFRWKYQILDTVIGIVVSMVAVVAAVMPAGAGEAMPDSSRHTGIPAEKLRLQKRIQDNPEDMEAWIRLCSWCAENNDADEAKRAGRKAIDLAAEGTSDYLAALAYTGQAYVSARDYDSARIYLHEGEILYETLSSKLSGREMVTVYTLFNALAIYTINSELN